MTQHSRVVAIGAGCLLVVLAGCGAAADVADSGRTETPLAPSSPTEPTTPTTSSAPTAPAATPPLTPEPPSGAELEAARSTPVEDPHYPDTSNPEVDALHYQLDLDWDGEVLTGTTTLTFRPTETTNAIRLDLSSALTVSSIEIDARPANFEQANDGLRISVGPGLRAGTTYTARISYAGSPVPTRAPSGRADMAEGLGWSTDEEGNVYTFQEPYGAFTWYPVNDHPSDEALYDARILTSGDDVGVFNGELVDEFTKAGQTLWTWHVDEPQASYLTTIAIGPYTEHVDETPSGMEISYWLMPRDEDLLEELQEEGARAFEWLEDTAGDYPFSTLGVVVVGGMSAMETQTMITMSRGAVVRADAVLQHEIAHQWFGDSVTPIDWRAVWLNEGWAMYLQQAYETDTGRVPSYGGIKNWRVFDNLSRSRSGPPGDYDPKTFGDSNIYLGPAMMLEAIRLEVGDQMFDELVQAWPAEHENANVDRATFTRWINQKTGRNLTPLIDTWLDSPQTPRTPR